MSAAVEEQVEPEVKVVEEVVPAPAALPPGAVSQEACLIRVGSAVKGFRFKCNGFPLQVQRVSA